jgi:hypothetical protein
MSVATYRGDRGRRWVPDANGGESSALRVDPLILGPRLLPVLAGAGGQHRRSLRKGQVP